MFWFSIVLDEILMRTSLSEDHRFSYLDFPRLHSYKYDRKRPKVKQTIQLSLCTILSRAPPLGGSVNFLLEEYSLLE